MKLEIDGRVWVGDDLPAHVKVEDARRIIEMEGQHIRRLGDTVLMSTPVFKPLHDIFEGIIGFDQNMLPIRAPDPTIAFTWTETL